ncbi:MAG TPA: hypothetical protein VIJ35_02175, partial [Bradyrhizobium sp.]
WNEAKKALFEAESQREQAEAARWEAVSQREQADAARWEAVRQYEASQETREEIFRQAIRYSILNMDSSGFIRVVLNGEELWLPTFEIRI